MEVIDADPEFVENLIKNVEKKTCLYNKCDKLYYNKFYREKCWTEIAANCGRASGVCKTRWKLLRERFTKQLKKIHAASASGTLCKDIWEYYDSLLFLEGFVVPRRSEYNIPNDNIKSETIKLNVSPPATPSPQAAHSPHASHSPHAAPSPNAAPSPSTTPSPVLTSSPLFDPLNTDSSLTQFQQNSRFQKFSSRLSQKKFERTLLNIDKSIENIAKYTKCGEYGKTLQAMDALLADVPDDLKDRFIAETFAKLMEIRAEARSRSNRISDDRITFNS